MRDKVRNVAVVVLGGMLAASCAASTPTAHHRHASLGTTTTQPAPPASSQEIPAPADLGVVFAPHACIAYPPLGEKKDATVFVDPGHGGADPGALGAAPSGPGVDEATANLAIALDVVPALRGAGYRVVLSRTTDTSVATATAPLGRNAVHVNNEARVACANAARANLLVGIYMNGFGDPTLGGAETIYDSVRSFSTDNEHFAQVLQSDVLASIRARGWSVPDRGVQTDDNQGSATAGAPAGWHHLFLLGPAYPGWNDHPSQMPGALIEPLFVTNPSEDAIVASPAGQHAIANGIVQAVESFTPNSVADSLRAAVVPSQGKKGRGSR